MSLRRAAAVLVLSAVLAGCGPGASGDDKPRLVVSAAASLKEALTSCSPQFQPAQVRLSFAGSDELAAQIRQSVTPDVFAAANTKLPDELNRDGLVGTPTQFATNDLVVAVPRGSDDVRSISDLTMPAIKLAVGSPSVPVGIYTRDVLSRLSPIQRQRILDNVRSNEPDVKGVVGKLIHRAVDAGFVYRSDVDATNGRLRAIDLPPGLRPTVTYAAAVVSGAQQPGLARRYIEGLLSGPCAQAIERAGFGPPPR